MTAEFADGGASPSFDELRRRVYRPDATAEDVAQYEAALAAAAAPASAADPAAGVEGGVEAVEPDAAGAGSAVPAEVPGPRPGRTRRRVLLAAAALVVALTAVVGISGAVRPAPPPRPAPVASPSPLGVDRVARFTFIRALVQGGSAGIGSYLDREPAGRPAALTTATRSETLERTGDGTRTLVLDPISRSAGDGGRATVILVLAVDAKATWAAYRFAIDEDHSVRRKRVAQRGGMQAAGVPSAGTFAFYPGQRPVRLRVTAPAGVRWGVAVVFTD